MPLKAAPELVFVLHAGNCTGIKFGNRGTVSGALRQTRETRQGSAAVTGQSIFRITTRNGVNTTMNKADFIEAVADGAELTKADAGRAVDAMIAAVTKALKKGDTVTLVGFGTFSVRKRGARTGRNPRTGETIKIKASKNPAFKAGKALKDAVN
jgi:DNA-binding protein HU-beta